MAAEAAQTTKTRSPNYATISLEDALQRVQKVYEKEHQHFATREVVAKALGYGTLNGASASLVSALHKYGLMERNGDLLRVSPLALDILLRDRGDPERAQAIQSAAFTPPLFEELRMQYGDKLPSDVNLRHYLVTKKGFNPKTVDGVIRVYRDTIEFVNGEMQYAEAENPAGLPEEKPMQTQRVSEGIPVGPSSDRKIDPFVPNDPRLRAINLPLTPTEWAILHAPFPLDEVAWNQMIVVLTAMKPALVVSTNKQEPQEDPVQPNVNISEDG